ncbi:MAG: hypothetical protein GY725_10435 [bacterium]|nr:hypothetical protein [bacterium]
MPHSRDLFDGVYTGRPEKSAKLRVLVAIGAAAFAIAVLFFGGEYVQRYLAYGEARVGVRGAEALRWSDPLRTIVLNTNDQIPRPRASQALLESGLRVYDLRIDPKGMKALQTIAERVTAQHISTDIPRDYVPAQFRDAEGWRPIQVKLRGLYSTHYLKNRPSLRLKFPKDRLFEGKRQINLTDPYDKGLTVDVTTNWELERYGILTWESRFVVLRVNSRTVGLFQEIEHFGRSMVDRTGRPEGFIFSGYGQLFGKQGAAYDKAGPAMERLKSCNTAEAAEPAPHCAQWSFLRDYLDVDRWAWAAALKLLLHSNHAWHPDNLRMFWDPARGKFEPIPWDYAAYPLNQERDVEGETLARGYGLTFCSVPEFRRLRDQRAWELITKRVEPMIDHAQNLFDRLTEPLRHDWRHMSLELDRKRQADYLEALRGNRDFLRLLFERRDMHARFWRLPAGRVAIEFENPSKSFVRITGYTLERPRGLEERQMNQPLIVDGLWQAEPGRSVVAVKAPIDAKLVGFAASNGITGEPIADAEFSIEAGKGRPPQQPMVEQVRLNLGLANVKQRGDLLIFGPGRVVLKHTVEIPENTDVRFAPGLDLQLASGVALILHGDLEAIGNSDRPIRVGGIKGRRDWGAVAVQGTRSAPSRVHLEYVRIRGGKGASSERTHFTSPFAVHDGVVILRENRFVDALADDGLNLKYAEVRVENNVIERSRDDAFDCDFCVGDVSGNRVIDAGGDGIDFSGSDVSIERNTITGCGDKGMSLGEGTRARVVRNRIRDGYTGIAIKDLSDVEIRDSSLSELQIGIALYVKKPTFGPSRASLSGVDMKNVATRYLRDLGCELTHLDPAPDAEDAG